MIDYSDSKEKMKSINDLKRRIKSMRRLNDAMWSNLFNMNYLNNKEHQTIIDNLNSMLMYIKTFLKIKNEINDSIEQDNDG